MADLLSNPWTVGIVTSVVGTLLVTLSTYGLMRRHRGRELGPEADRAKIPGKGKAFRTAAIVGIVVAGPAYHVGIWLWDSAVGGAELEQLAAGAVLRDCDACPTIMVVPAGSFSMGSPVGERGRYDNEGPIHPVSVPEAFGVSVYEVTRAQFREFVENSGHEAGEACWTFERRRWRERAGRSWRFPGYVQTEQHPVVCVNWDDANRYVEWLSLKTGQRYRLPTESEWEYAARAGTKTMYYWGDGTDDDWKQCRYANAADLRTGLFWRAGCDDGHEYTAAVGSYLPNPFGLHDMLGNVWEWTQDCWSDDYSDAPADGSAYEVGHCTLRVLRGGSRYVSAEGIRAAHRLRFDPLSRNQNTGFRVARWARSATRPPSAIRIDAETLERPVSTEDDERAEAAPVLTGSTDDGEFNCDTLTREIDDIPTSSVHDANIREVVSILIGDSDERATESQLVNLQCAGRLAKMPRRSANKDAELSRVIDANIRANQCSAARELTDHLQSSANKSTQKAKVARECLGRD